MSPFGEGPPWGPPWQRRRGPYGRRPFGRAGTMVVRAARRSIRARLTWAFVLVSWITLWVGYGAASYGHGRWQGHGLPLSVPGVVVPLLASAIFGAFTAERITRRLSRLRDGAERLNLRDPVRVPVEGADEVAALATTFNAMVDRLVAEERVRRNLVADVAHELRHPLAVLSGRLESMQDGVVPLDHEQVLHLQDMVIALTRLVGDLRDLSLADVGQLSLTWAPVDLSALAEELAENMAPVGADRSIRLTARTPGPLVVTADPDRIRQVAVNLLANALHYTPDGGEVEIAVERDGASHVRLTVRDSGPGIAPDRLERVFDRFYRGDSARSRAAGGGSGLGLSIVRTLVALHGGTVRAESPPSGGSRFVVRLPLVPPGAPGAPGAPSRQARPPA